MIETVHAAFGPDVAERYERAVNDPASEPGTRVDDVETAALIIVGVVPHLGVLLLQ